LQARRPATSHGEQQSCRPGEARPLRAGVLACTADVVLKANNKVAGQEASNPATADGNVAGQEAKQPAMVDNKVAGQEAKQPANIFMLTLKEIEKDNNVFFLTIKSIDGLPILLNKKYYQIILNSLEFCQGNKGWKIYAYTILINHLHLVLSILKEFSLSETVSNFKSYTANKILNQLRLDKQSNILDSLHKAANRTKDRKSKLWRRDCYPKAIISEKFLLQKVKYIDLNAKKHRLINDIEKYPYTSYHNHYCHHKVVLAIEEVGKLL